MTWSQTGIQLKSGLIDYYIFFLVFLFGVQQRRGRDEGDQVDRWSARSSPTSCTILDTVGIVNLGYHERIDGRTAGRDRRIQPVRRVHRAVPPGHHRGRRGHPRHFSGSFWLGGALMSLRWRW